MIHGRQSDRWPGPPQGARGRRRTGGRRSRAGRLLPALLALLLAPAACSENGSTQPGTLRFGQIGHMEVTLRAPLRLGEGQLLQVIRWSSSGAWSLEEAISYQGRVGDERILGSPGDPSAFASAYASLITQVNEVEGLELFLDELPQDLDPECAATRTRLTVSITDRSREETARWTRCANGSLANLTPRDAGPDPAASRVVEVARIARNGTVGESFASQYAGSVPFGTLDRGDDTPTSVRSPTVFTEEGQWLAFWGQHAPGVTAPDVDFSRDMVVAGIVGLREEAGDSVEVRRVLQVDRGTLVELWERVPGDFCTPADQAHVPFHIVVSPRTPDPVRFADVRVEQVPCGG